MTKLHWSNKSEVFINWIKTYLYVYLRMYIYLCDLHAYFDILEISAFTCIHCTCAFFIACGSARIHNTICTRTHQSQWHCKEIKWKNLTERELALYLLLCLSFNDNNNKSIKKRRLQGGDFLMSLCSFYFLILPAFEILSANLIKSCHLIIHISAFNGCAHQCMESSVGVIKSAKNVVN